MKRVLVIAVVVMLLPIVLLADGKKKGSTAKKPATKEPTEIQWITSIDELQAKMTKHPKKVYMDVYTGWCGWCKKMDATTFENPELIRYMNANFYAVKLDAERKDTIHYMGKVYYFDPQYKANTFAVELMAGGKKQVQLSFPTSIFMLEGFQSPQPVPGFHDVKEMESFLRYFGDSIYQRQPWADYSKAFVPTWKDNSPTAGMAPIPVH
jgi:thioredoxin-related protein